MGGARARQMGFGGLGLGVLRLEPDWGVLRLEIDLNLGFVTGTWFWVGLGLNLVSVTGTWFWVGLKLTV